MNDAPADKSWLTEEVVNNVLSSLLDIIESISDIEYQKRAWIKGIPPGTDFDETVNSYSLDAQGILESYKDYRLTEIQFHILNKFDGKFRAFWSNNYWPEDFIDTPEWTEIREHAKEVLKAFDYKPQP